MSIKNQYVKYGLVLLLSVGMILFTQEIKLLKDPTSTPVTMMTLYGLLCLWTFSMIGIFISHLMKNVRVTFIREFPILGWVSITSLILCLVSDFFVEVIRDVYFMYI